MSLGDARKLIEEEKGRLNSSADVNATLEALRDALPAGSEGREIASILPDMVGEAALLVWLGRGGVLLVLGIEAQSCIGRMAGTALDRVSQIVVRAAQDFAAAGRDEPVRWLDALAQASEAAVGALMQIAGQLPAQTLVLRELAVDLTRRIVDRLRTVAGSELEREDVAEAELHLLAGSLNNLGTGLSGLGRREEALAAAQEAVAIRRRLAAARPDAFLPDLAMSLNNLGAGLGNLGRRDEAVATAQAGGGASRRVPA
jgi:tetratricopeptide (TPR) repeat protein